MNRILLTLFSLISLSVFSQNTLQSELVQKYHDSIWINYSGTNYDYDNNGNLITLTQSEWDDSVWVNLYKAEYIYDSNNKVTMKTGYYWSENSEEYRYHLRSLYNYNSNGLISEYIVQYPQLTNWINQKKNNVTYNYVNNILEIDESKYENNQWSPKEYKIGGTYNANSLAQTISEVKIDTQWYETQRRTFTYDSNNLLETSLQEKMSGTTWFEDFTYDYDYDANFNVISQIRTNIGLTTKVEYAYDTTLLLSQTAHPFNVHRPYDYFEEPFPYVNKVLLETNFKLYEYNGIFVPTERTLYNYDAQLVLNTSDFVIHQELKLFPNPSSRFIQISGIKKQEKVVVYNLSGIKLIETLVTGNEKINIEKLSSGLYYLKLENGTLIKFVKK